MINQAQKIDYSAFVSEKYFRHFSDKTFSAESIIMPDPLLNAPRSATISLRYIVKFDHGYYEAYSDQTCSCTGKQVINLGQSIILASKFCSFPGKIGKHHCHFSLIHWNLLSENQPRSWRPPPPLVYRELKRRWSHFIQKVYGTDPLVIPSEHWLCPSEPVNEMRHPPFEN